MFLRLTRGARRRSIPGSAFELTARGFKTGGLDARRAPPLPPTLLRTASPTVVATVDQTLGKARASLSQLLYSLSLSLSLSLTRSPPPA